MLCRRATRRYSNHSRATGNSWEDNRFQAIVSSMTQASTFNSRLIHLTERTTERPRRRRGMELSQHNNWNWHSNWVMETITIHKITSITPSYWCTLGWIPTWISWKVNSISIWPSMIMIMKILMEMSVGPGVKVKVWLLFNNLKIIIINQEEKRSEIWAQLRKMKQLHLW